jgi:hypothetical protein
VTFRWGFKAECERIAKECRGELELGVLDRLDPFELANHLAIPTSPLAALGRHGASVGAISRFHNGDRSSLSAFTVFAGRKRLIFYNEENAKTRRSSDLSHELSHALLEHDPGPLENGQGRRLWKAEIEREADWLAGALLVPRDGAFALAREGRSVEDIADHFAVSVDLCQMRIRATGISIHLRRYTQKYGGKA